MVYKLREWWQMSEKVAVIVVVLCNGETNMHVMNEIFSKGIGYHLHYIII